MTDEITALRVENERLAAELAKAEASAREQVAGAYLAAAERAYLWLDDDDAQDLREHVRCGTPADATAALEARDARIRADERAKVIAEVVRIVKHVDAVGGTLTEVAGHIADRHTPASRAIAEGGAE